MRQLAGAAAAPLLATFLALDCGGNGDPAGVGGAGGSRTFDSGAGSAGEGATGANAGSGGSSTAGSSGSSSTGGGAGVGANGVAGSGTGGTESGAGGIVGAGGTSTATGGTDATGGVGGGTGGMNATGGTGGAAMPSITATASLESDSCDRVIAYEVSNVRDQNGALVSGYTCEWAFDDATGSSLCAGEHAFGEAGTHQASVIVRDTVTGAATTVTPPAVYAPDPLGLEVFAASYQCLQFEYTSNRQYGYGAGTYFVDIQPVENVLTPGPWPEDAVIQVAAAGSYAIRVVLEARAPDRVCTVTQTASVSVEACP